MKSLVIVNTVILLLLLGTVGYMLTDQSEEQYREDPEWIKEYAALLTSKELYEQAIEAYKRYAEFSGIGLDRRINANYMIGKIYQENLKDYENALAYFYKVKQFRPSGDLMNETNRNIVECLERMQRSSDAQRELDRITRHGAEAEAKEEEGVVLARIGDESITLEEIREKITELPEDSAESFTTWDGFRNFLRNYVAEEVIYKAALRQNLQKSPEIREKIEEVEKALLVQKVIETELADNVELPESDLRLYYKAHKDRYKKPAAGDSEEEEIMSFEEARQKIAADLARERGMEVWQNLINRLSAAEDVEFYEERIPEHPME